MASRKNKKASRSSSGSQLLTAFAVLAAGLCTAAVFAVSHLPPAPEGVSPDKKIGVAAKQQEHVPPAAIQTAVAETKKEVVTPATPLPDEEQIDVDGLTAHYQQRALDACLYAEKSGVLDTMRTVSDINGIHLEHMITLAIFESNMGRLEQTDTVKDAKDRTSAVGITQITEGAFLEMLGRYGKEAVSCIMQIDSEKSKELKYLLKFHKFNWKNSQVTLDSAAFNKAHKEKGEALKKRLLNMRVDKKIGKKLSVFLAFRDIEAKLPLLEIFMDVRAFNGMKEHFSSRGGLCFFCWFGRMSGCKKKISKIFQRSVKKMLHFLKMMLQLNATPFLSCRFGSWEIATQGRARGKREVC